MSQLCHKDLAAAGFRAREAKTPQIVPVLHAAGRVSNLEYPAIFAPGSRIGPRRHNDLGR